MPDLSEKDMHCIARLIQAAITNTSEFGFTTCMFCKYQPWCRDAEHSDVIREKLTRETGVDLMAGDVPLHAGAVPYRRLLRNSNGEVKEHFRKYFKDVL